MFARAPTTALWRHIFNAFEDSQLLEFKMRKTAVVCAILGASLLSGPFAIAQGDSRFGDRGRNDQGQRSNERDRRDVDARPSNNNGNQGRGNAYGHTKRYDRIDRGERGVGPEHGYYRGDRMPLQYRSSRYVVEDWRGHYLSAPPRGYHWVQSGGDYVLVAIATGIILQLLLSN
jgi:Ni/Co efflux regulator RcnB